MNGTKKKQKKKKKIILVVFFFLSFLLFITIIIQFYIGIHADKNLPHNSAINHLQHFFKNSSTSSYNHKKKRNKEKKKNNHRRAIVHNEKQKQKVEESGKNDVADQKSNKINSNKEQTSSSQQQQKKKKPSPLSSSPSFLNFEKEMVADSNVLRAKIHQTVVQLSHTQQRISHNNSNNASNSNNSLLLPYGFVMKQFGQRVLSRSISQSNVLVVTNTNTNTASSGVGWNLLQQAKKESHATYAIGIDPITKLPQKTLDEWWFGFNNSNTEDTTNNKTAKNHHQQQHRPNWVILCVLDLNQGNEDNILSLSSSTPTSQSLSSSSSSFFTNKGPTITYLVVAVTSTLINNDTDDNIDNQNDNYSYISGGKKTIITLLKQKYKVQLLSATDYWEVSGKVFRPNDIINENNIDDFFRWGATSSIISTSLQNCQQQQQQKCPDSFEFYKYLSGLLKRNTNHDSSFQGKPVFKAYLFATQGLDLAIPSRRVHINKGEFRYDDTVFKTLKKRALSELVDYKNCNTKETDHSRLRIRFQTTTTKNHHNHHYNKHTKNHLGDSFSSVVEAALSPLSVLKITCDLKDVTPMIIDDLNTLMTDNSTTTKTEKEELLEAMGYRIWINKPNNVTNAEAVCVQLDCNYFSLRLFRKLSKDKYYMNARKKKTSLQKQVSCATRIIVPVGVAAGTTTTTIISDSSNNTTINNKKQKVNDTKTTTTSDDNKPKESLYQHQQQQTKFQPPNLLVLMIDPISRPQFDFLLPRTKQYMEDNLGLVRFENYATVGNNSGPNQAALYAGKVLKSREGIKSSDKNNDYSWIWDELREKGRYVTFKSEDGCIENSNMVQSMKPNTTHGHALYELFCFHYHRPNCIGTQFASEYLLSHARQFIKTYSSKITTITSSNNKNGEDSNSADYTLAPHPKQRMKRKTSRQLLSSSSSPPPWAAFLSFTDSHEDTMTLAGILDQPIKNFLSWFKSNSNKLASSSLNSNTMVVLLSDHGLHYGPYFQSKAGQRERSMPVLYAGLLSSSSSSMPAPPRPPLLATDEDGETNNPYLRYGNNDILHANRNKWVTPFDVHKTILDLLLPKKIKNNNNSSSNSTSTSSYSNNNRKSDSNNEKMVIGSSLFEKLPDSRNSCRGAEYIPEQHCRLLMHEDAEDISFSRKKSTNDNNNTNNNNWMQFPPSVLSFYADIPRDRRITRNKCNLQPHPVLNIKGMSNAGIKDIFDLTMTTENVRSSELMKTGCQCSTNVRPWFVCTEYPWNDSRNSNSKKNNSTGESLQHTKNRNNESNNKTTNSYDNEIFLIVFCPKGVTFGTVDENPPLLRKKIDGDTLLQQHLKQAPSLLTVKTVLPSLFIETRVVRQKSRVSYWHRNNDNTAINDDLSQLPPNILFLEIDSVSVPYADRHFPLTRKLLRKYHFNDDIISKNKKNNMECNHYDNRLCAVEFTNFATVGPNSITNQVAALSGCYTTRFHKSCFIQNKNSSSAIVVPRPKKGDLCVDPKLPEYGMRLQSMGPGLHTVYCPAESRSASRKATVGEGKENMNARPFLYDIAKEEGYITYFGEEFCYNGSPWVVQDNVFPLPDLDIMPHQIFCCIAKLAEPTVPDNKLYEVNQSDGPCIGDGRKGKMGGSGIDKQSLPLQLIKQMWDSYPDAPKFVYLNALAAHVYESDYAKAALNAEAYDEVLSKFLESFLQRDDVAKNTIVVVRSDHGFQGDFTVTVDYSTQVEQSYPWTEIIVPNKNNKDNGDGENKYIIQQIVKNSNRLLTSFDLYATLHDLMTMSSSSSANRKRGAQPPPPTASSSNTGSSDKASAKNDNSSFLSYNIFEETVPINRTCEEARIPLDFCHQKDPPSPTFGTCNAYETNQYIFCRDLPYKEVGLED